LTDIPSVPGTGAFFVIAFPKDFDLVVLRSARGFLGLVGLFGLFGLFGLSDPLLILVYYRRIK
jgi:hypothetical protein